jgi:poly-gamma-glutamate synthesis protein (capsule biosynthesis protein)
MVLRRAAKVFICAVFFSLTAGAAFAAVDDDGTIRARAVFIGDIMAHEQQLEAARRGELWDFNPQFRRVKPLFWNSLAIGNLETVFAGQGVPFAGYPMFNTPDSLAGALADLGIDVAVLANNHIMDKGAKAAARTAEVLDGAGIFWTGLSSQDDPYEPLIVEYAGLRWALVNYSYGSNTRRTPKSGDLRLNVISPDAIIHSLARASAYEPDITVAFFHWGIEYQYNPTKSQRSVADLCLSHGADLVIGAHPHVVQPVEITSSDRGYAAVAYSLGNFVSYQRTKPRERSFVLAADFEKKPGEPAKLSRLSVAPTWVSARREGGRLKIETVYAGEGGPFNHAGLPGGERQSARAAGRAVLEFLGARNDPARDGFYILWDAASPDLLPSKIRRNPE